VTKRKKSLERGKGPSGKGPLVCGDRAKKEKELDKKRVSAYRRGKSRAVGAGLFSGRKKRKREAITEREKKTELRPRREGHKTAVFPGPVRKKKKEKKKTSGLPRQGKQEGGREKNEGVIGALSAP